MFDETKIRRVEGANTHQIDGKVRASDEIRKKPGEKVKKNIYNKSGIIRFISVSLNVYINLGN